jgi:adenylate kinase family enzyme
MKPLTPATPRAIIMVGIPGAGKSTFAEKFSKTFQAPLLNPALIQATANLSPAATAKITALMLEELLKTQRTIIYDGPSATLAQRRLLAKQMANAGYDPLLVWVQTESMEAKRRALRVMSAEVFEQALKRFSPPIFSEKAIVISGKHVYASQLKIVLKRIAGEPKAPQAPTTPEQKPDREPDRPRARSTRNIILR